MISCGHAVQQRSCSLRHAPARRYTFNTESNILNSTFYNIKEREGFIIRPFTIPVASAAVKYSIERNGYRIEPSFDLNTQVGLGYRPAMDPALSRATPCNNHKLQPACCPCTALSTAR